MAYKLVISPAVGATLRRIKQDYPADFVYIQEALEALTVNPSAVGSPFAVTVPGLYDVVCGHFDLLYEVRENDDVVILGIEKIFEGPW